jgi:L-ascorbate metabolism protein UlaG (beta-lactamase superfamily)
VTGSSPLKAERRRAATAIEVLFVGHSTTLIDLGGVRILTDPCLGSRLGPLRRHGPTPDPKRLVADVVVVSHGHPDHFSRRSLGLLPGRPVLVVPKGLAAPIRRARSLDLEATELVAGEAVAIGDLTIRATAARHWISPGAPRAAPVGYVLERGGRRVYFAGDTAAFAAMADMIGAVDLALLPVGTWGPHRGPGHLGPRSAADAVRALRPAAAIPIHWGTLYPVGLHRVWRRPLDEPGPRFAALARELAPDVDVRVLRPGEATTLATS